MRNKKGQFIKGFPYNKGIKRSENFRDMRRRLQTGKKLSEETKKKISESHKGKTRSLEYRRNISKSKMGTKNPMFGKKLTVEQRMKRSLARRGSESPRWKGGISFSNKRIRVSFEYRLWRESVFERDGRACVWCGRNDIRIQADHIQLFSTHPELRFAIDNGRTLCLKCHKIRHSKKL